MSDAEVNIKITATDDASGPLKDVSTSLDGVGVAAGKIKPFDTVGLVTGISGVATAAWGLVDRYDNLQNAQVGVDKAMLSAKSSAKNAEDAQVKYNDAVAKFGPDSDQAISALRDLELAQERASIAQERAEVVSGNLKESYVGFAVSVVPSVITGAKGLSDVFKVVSDNGGLAKTAGDLLKGSMEGLKGAFTLITSHPILIVVGLIAGALIYAYQNCEPFRNAVNAIAGVLSGYLSTALTTITGALTWLGENVLPVLSSAWERVTSGISGFWNTYITPIIDLIAGYVQATIADWMVTLDELKGVWDTVTSAISGFWSTYITPIIDYIGGALTTAFNGFMTLMGTVGDTWNTITSAISDAWDTYVAPLAGIIQGFADTINGIFTTLFGWIIGGSSWTDMCRGIASVWDTVAGPVAGVIQAFSDTLGGIFNALRDTIGTIWTTLTDTLSSVWNTVSSTLQTAFNTFSSAVQTTFSGLKTGIETIWGGITGAIQTAAGSIGTIIGGVLTRVGEAWSTVQNFVGNAASAVSGAISEAQSRLSGIGSSISSALSGVSSAVTDAVAGAVNWITGGGGGGVVTNTVQTPTITPYVAPPNPTYVPSSGISSYVAQSGVTMMQTGYHGVISRPTLALIGEHGPERVDVDPVGESRASAGGTFLFSPNITITGNTFQGIAGAEELADVIYDKISRRVRNEMKSNSFYTRGL